MTTKATTAQLLATKQVKAFLAALPVIDQNTILHELNLIADHCSLDFAPVQNPKIYEWCLAHGLQEPQRFKIMTIRPDKGGIRVIFAFTQADNPQLMYVLKVGYRDENIYGDGR